MARRHASFGRARRCLVVAVVIVLLSTILLPQGAFAGWRSVWGKVKSVATEIVARGENPGGAAIKVWLGGIVGSVASVLVGIDQILEAIKRVDPPPPSGLPGNKTPPDSIKGAPTFASATLPNLTAIGPDTTALTGAANATIDGFNALTANIRREAPSALEGDIRALAIGLGQMADAFEPFNFSISQEDINSLSRLPAAQVTFLSAAGFSNADIQALENYIVGMEVTLAVSSIDVVTVLRDVSDSLQPVPEPSTLLLLGSSLAGLGGMAWRRQRRK